MHFFRLQIKDIGCHDCQLSLPSPQKYPTLISFQCFTFFFALPLFAPGDRSSLRHSVPLCQCRSGSNAFTRPRSNVIPESPGPVQGDLLPGPPLKHEFVNLLSFWLLYLAEAAGERCLHSYKWSLLGSNSHPPHHSSQVCLFPVLQFSSKLFFFYKLHFLTSNSSSLIQMFQFNKTYAFSVGVRYVPKNNNSQKIRFKLGNCGNLLKSLEQQRGHTRSYSSYNLVILVILVMSVTFGDSILCHPLK